MKDIDFEVIVGISTVCFIGGFLIGILMATIITTTSINITKNNYKQTKK